MQRCTEAGLQPGACEAERRYEIELVHSAKVVGPVGEMVEAFFSMPTVILEPMTMKQLGKGITTRDGRRAKKRSSFTQFDATDILRQLQKHKPHDAHTLCAVTMLDIYKGGFNFLFGLGSLQSGVGVFSFCRHDPGSICCDEWNGLSPAGTRGPGDEDCLLYTSPSPRDA